MVEDNLTAARGVHHLSMSLSCSGVAERVASRTSARAGSAAAAVNACHRFTGSILQGMRNPSEKATHRHIA